MEALMEKQNDSFKSYLVNGARFCGAMELPSLSAVRTVPESLTEFRRLQSPSAKNQFIHFYLDDKKFKCIYENPHRYINWFKRFAGIIGFDFSIHAECPMYKQIENFGKSRELSFWFSKQGIPVIPNVRWGLEETYGWCFDGLPENSTLAVSTLGCSRNRLDRQMFVNGLWTMIERLKPRTIVVYGTKSQRMFPPLLVMNTNLAFFESQFTVSHLKGVCDGR